MDYQQFHDDLGGGMQGAVSIAESSFKNAESSSSNSVSTTARAGYNNGRKLQRRIGDILEGKQALHDSLTGLVRPLDTYHTNLLDRELKHLDVSKQVFQRWQCRFSELKLEPDPIISIIREPEVSSPLLALQKRFFEEGDSGFSCHGFKVTLRNILKCIDYELQHGGKLKPEFFHELKKDVLSLADGDQPIPYQSHLVTCTRFAALLTLNHSALYSAEIREQLADFFSKLTYEFMASDYFSMSQSLPYFSEDSSRVTSDLSFGDSVAMYARHTKRFLMWPCFDTLDSEFFLQAARYRIKPAGLSSQPLGLHDAVMMSPLFFFGHDFFHQEYWTRHGDDPVQIQTILDRIVTQLHDVGADEDTKTAVWLILFQYHHEDNACLTGLEREGFSFDLKDLAYNIDRGVYEFNKTIRVEHIYAAYEILTYLFPRKS